MGELIGYIAVGFAFFVGTISAIIAAIALDLIRDQAKASTPWLADWLRRQAVKRLPELMRKQADEEWASWLEETPGPLAKLWCAIGFLNSAFRVQTAPTPQTKTDNKSITTRANAAISPPTSYAIENYVQFLRTLDERQLKVLVREGNFVDRLIWITYEYDWNDNRESLQHLLRILKTHRNSIVHNLPVQNRDEDDS